MSTHRMTEEAWIKEPASVKFTPLHSGDGYSFGGASMLCIGPFAIPIGEHLQAPHLAKEIADRWNEDRDAELATDLLGRLYGAFKTYGSPSGVEAAEGLLLAIKDVLDRRGGFS